MQRDRGRPHAALGARDRDELAAERGARRLLAGDAVAHRARPLRRGADAGLEGLERERERDDVAQAGLHRGAQQPGRVLGGEQDQPDLGERGGEVAREVEHRRAAERVVQQHDVDVQPAQRAVQLVEVGRPCRRPRARPRGPARPRGGRSRRRRRRSAAARSPVTPSCPSSGRRRGRSSRRACARPGRRGRSSASRTSAAKVCACATLSSWRLVSANVTGTTSPGPAGPPGRCWPPFSARLADGDHARARDDHDRAGGLRLDACCRVAGLGGVGGDHVDLAARLDLAGHAGRGVDQDRDLALALVDLGRRGEHALLEDRVGLQVGGGDVADELRAVAQRGARRPALGDRASSRRVVGDRLVGLRPAWSARARRSCRRPAVSISET